MHQNIYRSSPNKWLRDLFLSNSFPHTAWEHLILGNPHQPALTLTPGYTATVINAAGNMAGAALSAALWSYSHRLLTQTDGSGFANGTDRLPPRCCGLDSAGFQLVVLWLFSYMKAKLQITTLQSFQMFPVV